VVLVQSPTNAFLDRVFYGTSVGVQAGQVASQSMGDLPVAEGIVKTYAILDSENSDPFEGLVFSYNTAAAFSTNAKFSGLNQYQVYSTFDSQTGLYSITLAKDLAYLVTASGDIDGDGIVDFGPENNNFWYADSIRLDSTQAMALETMYVNETEAYQPVELRMTVIDEFGEIIEGVAFFASDLFKGRLETSFDSDTMESVFNYQTSSRVDLNMPSFTTADDIAYQSASIDLTWASENTLSIYDYGFQNNLPSSIEVVDGVATVVVQPRRASMPSDYVSLVSSVVNVNNNYSLNQFYQATIGLLADSVLLERRNVFTVTKGDASASDLVPAATTQIGLVSQGVTLSNSLAHNNTFLTSSPVETLQAGDYRYTVTSLVNPATGNEFNVNFSDSFVVEPTTNEIPSFDLNDIKLDNNNGTNNGAIIVATNTVGQANSSTDYNNSTRLYFPCSIRSLDYLELNLQSDVRNGNVYTYTRQIQVVNGETIYQPSRYLVSLATNHNIESFPGYYGVSVDSATALADGQWYYANYIGIYSTDNTAANVNTATFSYIYIHIYRVAGETQVYEDTIILPVL
jgi:hypothetical protein